MDSDRKVKIKALFQNSSMREKTCYCGRKLTKLNKDEFTLDKCNIKELKKQRREERFDRLIDKYGKVINPILWGLLFPILIPSTIFYCIVT